MEKDDDLEQEEEEEADMSNATAGTGHDNATTTTTTSSSGPSEEQERKNEQSRVIQWLLQSYAVLGRPGDSIKKSDVYKDYRKECAAFSEISFTPTFFGKLVKRAFPGIKDMRKGPRGSAKQHYARLQRLSGEDSPAGAEGREGDVQRAVPKPNIVFRHYDPSRHAATSYGDPHTTAGSAGPGGEGGDGGVFGGRTAAGGRAGIEEEAALKWVDEAHGGKKRKAASGDRTRAGKQGRREGEAGSPSSTAVGKGERDIEEQIRNLLLGEKGLPLSALSTLVDEKGEIDLALLPMLSGRPAAVPSEPSLSTSTSTSATYPAPSPTSTSATSGMSPASSAPSASSSSAVTSSSPDLNRRGFLSSILRQRVGAKANASRSPTTSTPPQSSMPSPQLSASTEAEAEMRMSPGPRQYHMPHSPPIMPVMPLLPAAEQFSYPHTPTRSYQHHHPHHHRQQQHQQQQHQHQHQQYQQQLQQQQQFQQQPHYFQPQPHPHPHQQHAQPPHAHPPPHYHPQPQYPPHHHYPSEYPYCPCPTCFQADLMEEPPQAPPYIPHPQHASHPYQLSSSSSTIPRSHSSPSLSTFANESSFSHSSSSHPSRSQFSSSRSTLSASGSGRYSPPPLPPDHPHFSRYSLPPAPAFIPEHAGLPIPYSPPSGGPPQPQQLPAPTAAPAPSPRRILPQDYAQHPHHRSSPQLFGTGGNLLGPAGEEEEALLTTSGRKRAAGRLYHSNPLPTYPQRYQQYAGGVDGMPSVPMTPPSSMSPPPSLSSSRGSAAPHPGQLSEQQQQQQMRQQLSEQQQQQLSEQQQPGVFAYPWEPYPEMGE